jgi:indolepyruvate ferredoxin oxidoreductase beta subunit
VTNEGIPTRNVLLAGVGGHGVLALSRIVAEGALAAGFDVRKSEIHGMSQRGGSVVSEVRYGEDVRSPLIPEAAADVFVSLELLEALRHLHRLRPGGLLLVNDQRITPAPTGSGPVDYPEDAIERLREAAQGARILPAHDIAVELGEPRATNMVMLGAFAAFTPEIAATVWTQMIETTFRPALRAVNLAAFQRGLEIAPEA